MKSCAYQIYQALKTQEARIQSVVIVLNGSIASVLQESLIRENLAVTGSLPRILPLNDLGSDCQNSLKKTSFSPSMILQLIQQTQELAQNFAQSVRLAERILDVIRVCERYGASLESPPFTLKTDTPLVRALWDLAQKFWRLHGNPEAHPSRHLQNVEALLKQTAPHTVFFLDVFPSVHFDALDQLRELLNTAPNGQILTVHDPLNPVLHYQEYASMREEAIAVALAIQKESIDHPTLRMAVISDQDNLMAKIKSELIALQIPVQGLDPFPTFSQHESGSLVYDLAQWQATPTNFNLLRIFKNSFFARSLSAEFKMKVDFFAQKMVMAPSEIIHGEIFNPPVMDITKTAILIQKNKKTADFLQKWFDSLLVHLFPFPASSLTISETITLHQKAWEHLWILAETVPPFPLPFVSADPQPNFTIPSQDYLCFVQCVLKTTPLPKEIPSPSPFPSGLTPQVNLLSTQQATHASYDLAFLPGMDEGFWFKSPSLGPFFEEPPHFSQNIEGDLWHYILAKAPSQASRSFHNDREPHRFLAEVPKLKPTGEHVESAIPQALSEFVTASPPSASRPTSLSITDIQLLNDDPYAFYAKKILKLFPTRPPNLSFDYGKWAHDILDLYFKENALKNAVSMDIFAKNLSLPHPLLARRFLPRLSPVLKQLDAELEALTDQRERTLTEHSMLIPFEVAGVLYQLKGIADRIDILNGSNGKNFTVIDYKTSTLPPLSKITQLEALQLPIEALMLSQQFPSLGLSDPPSIRITLQQLKHEEGQANRLSFDVSEAFLQKTVEKLQALLSEYKTLHYVFESHSSLKNRAQFYVHLSRIPLH